MHDISHIPYEMLTKCEIIQWRTFEIWTQTTRFQNTYSHLYERKKTPKPEFDTN